MDPFPGKLAFPPTVSDAGLVNRRVAVVHDWIQGYHGSERVVEAIREALVTAGDSPEVFTFHAARDVVPASLAGAIVRESYVASLPGLRQQGDRPGRWRYLLPYVPYYFRHLDLNAYDVVVSSSHACALNARSAPGAAHVCYCHTPMRYAWLPGTDARLGSVAGVGLRALRGWLRRVDLRASRNPDSFVANSTAVRDRIRRFYGRDAVVIHPPVEVRELNPDAVKEPGHFLWVQRLVRYKRPELVVEAFRGSHHRLTMVGIGPLEARLRRSLPPNVELRGWISRQELVSYYEQACGFIHVAEEDFGISMVEALAAGTPVIALAQGGARDIVRPDVDGVLIDRADVCELRGAVDRVAAETWDTRALADRAATFSRERFVRRFLAHLDDAVATKRLDEPPQRRHS